MPVPLAFVLPDDMSLRNLATALASELLPPYLASPARPKGPRWVLKAVIHNPSGTAADLWEAGISTEEYQQRLEDPSLSWQIRADLTHTRGRGITLAEVKHGDTPGSVVVEVADAVKPGTPFDPAKLSEHLGTEPTMPDLFRTVLTEVGGRELVQ